MIVTSLLALTLGGLVLIWAGIFAYVIVMRALYDVQKRIVDASRRRTRRRMVKATRAGGEIDVDRILGRLRVATLLRASADTTTRTAIARVFSQHLLRRAEPRIRRLLVPPREGRWQRPDDRWRRIAALRVAAIGGLPEAMALLQQAIRSADEEIRAASVRILGELGTPAAHKVLIETLRNGSFAPSRVASQLEGTSPSLEALLPLLEDAAPIARYWGAKLLESTPDSAAATGALLEAADDDNANVRAAAAGSLRGNPSEPATRALVALLKDSSPHVRLHAARSLGTRGTVAAATEVASLLGDRDWWVRSSAKRALEDLGSQAVPAVVQRLGTNDEFEGNGAAEVLRNLGVVRTLVDHVAASTGGDGGAAATQLAPILLAGGKRFTSLALEHLHHDEGTRVRTLVGHLS